MPLAKRFIQQEEDAFNLFKVVGQLKSQVETTEMLLFELQAQIDKVNLEKEDIKKRSQTGQPQSKPKVSILCDSIVLLGV